MLGKNETLGLSGRYNLDLVLNFFSRFSFNWHVTVYFCRPYYDIGALGTSSLYRVGDSIFAFTPQVNIALVTFGECTNIFVYVEQRY